MLGQEPLQDGPQLRYSEVSYIPNLIQVNTDIVMNQNVPHAADGFPIQPAQAAASINGNALGRFSDYLNVSDHGILQFLGFEEYLSSGPDEAGDALATLQHVMQVQPIVFHRVVASHKILSRTYQWSDFSVPT